MAQLCDICGLRPATMTITTVKDGRQEVLHLCDVDYASYRQQNPRRGFDSLFNQPFGSLFPGFEDYFGPLSSELGSPLPRRDESLDIGNYFSEQTKAIIEDAGRSALDFGRNEVDTEHLLNSLLDNEVVAEIIKQNNIDITCFNCSN